MSNDGGTVQQPSRTTVPLGKSVRRALRAAIGVPKKPPRKDRAKLKPKKKKKPNPGRSTSLSKEAAAARKESVVRVVLSSGVVEVYPCVVPARAVVSRHPPGLCLARPDVFRNPHGAVLRPDEPLFPGHKFLLVPWSTVDKLKHRIPESSVGAFLLHDDDDGDHLCYGSAAAAAADEDGDDDVDDDDTAGSEEVLSTETEASEEEEEQERRRHSSGGGGGAPAAVVEWDDGEAAAGDGSGGGGSFTPACSARGYFEARDRWYECRFRRLVEQGIAVEPSAEDDGEGGGGGGGGQQPEQSRRKDGQQQQARSKGSSKKKKKKKRRERPPAAAAAAPTPGFRAFATATLRRTWEPSLPSVEEEENAAVSPLSSGLHSPSASVGAGGGGQPAQN
jgi:hypothetical protein